MMALTGRAGPAGGRADGPDPQLQDHGDRSREEKGRDRDASLVIRAKAAKTAKKKLSLIGFAHFASLRELLIDHGLHRFCQRDRVGRGSVLNSPQSR